ncbi:hypothetical protein [Methylophilus sp. 14]|uniref:hypothetical protein n=1 Tax=Methylophilus sp. 14 TaxID=2781019 RepID=UPI00188E337D|nr:hypothetical protein [Methylophilus sp. 14]MBF4988637.1 hypothetical protein [Methylophilus sp. 14]
MSVNEGGYLIPGHKVDILKTDSDYKADCFCEISVTWQRNLNAEEEKLVAIADNTFYHQILAEARESFSEPENILDTTAGALGLAIHRQLVLKPLIEHLFFTGGPQPVSSFHGPTWERLDNIGLSEDGKSTVSNLLGSIGQAPEKASTKAGAVLHWLLKAWRERDHITKFMYLFIPLEAVIQSTPELAAEAVRELNAIKEIVEQSESKEKIELIHFIERTKTKFNPTLNARFEELAKKHSLPGWELDVEAFKKFNRMRNLLLHKGNRRLSTHIDFEHNTRTLEDLVERYVALEIVGTPTVYQSNHRPHR